MRSSVPAPILGGCLCSEVRYRIKGGPLARSLCHCRSCRLAAGAAGVAWLVVRSNDFKFTAATPRRYQSSAHVVRTFCGTCGSSLTYQHDESPETIDITTATLDAPDDFAPTREIWLEQRLAWEKPDERLVHFQRDTSE